MQSRKRFKPDRQRRMLGLGGGLLVVALALIIGADYWLPAIGHWLVYPAQPHPADAIVVYGGSDERTSYAVELYRQGLAPQLWHTGYAENRTRVVNSILAQGLPPQAIYYGASTSTWTDAQAILALAEQQQARRLLLVTSWYHGRRAVCALQSQLNQRDLQLYYAMPPLNSRGPDNWWQSGQGREKVFSELLKFAYYYLRYGMPPWSC